MPEFSPFTGIRYDCRAAGASLDALAAPPYDVVDDDLHAALEAQSPNNSVRLILPRDESRDGDRYERAAVTFSDWLARGILFADPAPRFYAYTMTFTDPQGRARHTHGVLGALAPSRIRRRRRPAPRTHAAEGEVRSPRAAPRDARATSTRSGDFRSRPA